MEAVAITMRLVEIILGVLSDKQGKRPKTEPWGLESRKSRDTNQAQLRGIAKEVGRKALSMNSASRIPRRGSERFCHTVLTGRAQ